MAISIWGDVTAHNVSVEASNRLYRGEVSSFAEAMRLIMRGMDAEKRDTAEWNAAHETGETDEPGWSFDLGTDLEDEYQAAAKAALAIYTQHKGAGEERVLRHLRAARDGKYRFMAQIADAFERGDYSTLAW